MDKSVEVDGNVEIIGDDEIGTELTDTVVIDESLEVEESDEDVEESEEEENLVIPELDDKEGEGEMFGGWVWDERSLREELD